MSRRAPDVGVRTATAVPNALLRVASGMLGALVLLVASATPGRGLAPAFVAVGALLLAVLVLAPATAAAGGLVAVVGLRVLSGDAPALATLLALVLLVHLLLWCTATTARVPWRGRVEVAVLADGLQPVAGMQVAAQVLAVAATVMAGRADGDVGRVVALVAATAVAWVALSRPVRSFVGSSPD